MILVEFDEVTLNGAGLAASNPPHRVSNGNQDSNRNISGRICACPGQGFTPATGDRTVTPNTLQNKLAQYQIAF